MRVDVTFHGILAGWVGAPSGSFTLRKGAALCDLHRAIKKRHGRSMPVQMWDGERDAFNKKVMAVRDGAAVTDLGAPLRDGDTIVFQFMSAGG